MSAALASNLYVATVTFRKPAKHTTDCFITGLTLTIECKSPNQAVDYVKDWIAKTFAGVEVLQIVVR
jgi:hypothetical protein